MEKEPKPGSSLESKKTFDLQKFQDELTQTTEEYADITYGQGCDLTEIKEKERKVAELFDQLLDMCAKALCSTTNNEEVMKIIDHVLVYYTYKVGRLLFGGGAQSSFYRDLLLRVAKEKTEKPVE